MAEVIVNTIFMATGKETIYEFPMFMDSTDPVGDPVKAKMPICPRFTRAQLLKSKADAETNLALITARIAAVDALLK